MPNTLSVLFKQQLRWRRSIVRDLFYTLRTLPQHVWKLHPNTVFTLVLTPLGAIVAFLVAVTIALSADPLAWAGPLPLVTALGIGAVLTAAIKKYSAREALAHPLVFWLLMSVGPLVSSLFLTPLALCTMDSADRARGPRNGTRGARWQRKHLRLHLRRRKRVRPAVRPGNRCITS